MLHDPPSLALPAINAMDQAAFTQALGGVFENSPWVAENAWDRRPFSNIVELHEAMLTAVKTASRPQHLALLCAHPDLAGHEAQAGTMTSSSTAEQADVGLNALTKQELAHCTKFNTEYRQKFGFPFIIAVRNHTKEGIFREMERRLGNDADAEVSNALQEVFTITRLRLDKLVDD